MVDKKDTTMVALKVAKMAEMMVEKTAVSWVAGMAAVRAV